METRYIELSLDTAKRWYEQGGELKDITDLVSLVGLNDFSFGGTTYTTIQGVLTAIDDRIKALEAI